MQEKRERERERERSCKKRHPLRSGGAGVLFNAGRFLLLPAKAPSRSGGGAGYGLLSRVALDRSLVAVTGWKEKKRLRKRCFASSMLWSLLLS